jgi:hypothetical protein
MKKSIQMVPAFTPKMQRLKAEDLNTILDTCKELVAKTAAAKFEGIAETWLGIIDATDQTDYADERYWVKPAKCTVAAGTNTALLTFAALAAPSIEYQQVTATNLAELAAHSHQLSAGSIIIVCAVHDAQALSVKHYYFWQAGASTGTSAIPIKLSASLGSGAYTGKEQEWNGATWADKSGANNITVYNLFETNGVGSMSAVVVTSGPIVLVSEFAGHSCFERETNAFYKA